MNDYHLTVDYTNHGDDQEIIKIWKHENSFNLSLVLGECGDFTVSGLWILISIHVLDLTEYL